MLVEIAKRLRFVPAKQMENLSDLPYNMLVEIAKRLKKLEDFTSFRSISKSLCAAVNEEYFEGLRFRQGTPYLMLPVRDGNDDIREFYSLVEGESMVASVEVPKFKTKMCFESLGWLLTVEVDGSMSLLDPFSSGTEIPIPHQNTFPGYDDIEMDEHIFIQKMVLSSRPSETSDFILMVIAGGLGHLGFWRLGDKAWNRINDRSGQFLDVVYDGGKQFIAICGDPGIIYVMNLAGNDNHVESRIVDCEPFPYGIPYRVDLYILKSVNNSLLSITRCKDIPSFITIGFHVYEVDIERSTRRRIYSLGSMAVFLGHNSSIAVDASRFRGGVIKPNHIYFTDDDFLVHHNFLEDDWKSDFPEAKGGGVDSGVYNLETGAIEPIYPVEPLLSKVSPAMWITPSLC